jgi:alcohol dehydrogenase
MEYNLPYRTKRVARIGQAWFDADTEELSDDASAKIAIEYIRKLSDEINIPSLCDTPFDPKDISILAENALKDACAANNYVTATKQDIENILMNAYVEGIAKKVKIELENLSK